MLSENQRGITINAYQAKLNFDNLIFEDFFITDHYWCCYNVYSGGRLEKFKDNGIQESKIEGKDSNEWKLVDGIDLIVHIFHPEKRKFYELEKMWSELIPKEKLII